MARLNVDYKKISVDRKFKALVKRVGSGDAWEMVLRFWDLAQDHWKDGCSLVPVEAFELDGDLEPLVIVGLAERRPEGIYARGSEERFAWIAKCSQGGKTTAKKKEGAAIAAEEKAERELNAPLKDPALSTMQPTSDSSAQTVDAPPLAQRPLLLLSSSSSLLLSSSCFKTDTSGKSGLPVSADPDSTLSADLAAPPPEPPLESKSKLSWAETDHKAAKWLQRQIRASNPKARRVEKANLDEWANEFRLMRERDDLTHADIGEVMCWVFDDSFWRAQIQSPAKLRAKWDTLTAQMAAQILKQERAPQEKRTQFSAIPAHRADPQAPVAEESTVLWMPPGEAL